MHRHLLGLDSPPADYVLDRLASSLALPEGWDGDAWVKVNGRNYFLRAWCVESGRVAYGSGQKYEDSHRELLTDISEGTRRVKISIHETKPS